MLLTVDGVDKGGNRLKTYLKFHMLLRFIIDIIKPKILLIMSLFIFS